MEKTKKKHGCLYAFLIGLAVFIVLIIFLIITINNVVKVFGLSTKTYAEYIKLLNQEVSEIEIAPNRINSGDYISFKTKATNAGFDIFDSNGNVQAEKTTILINENLSLTNFEFAAMINNVFVNSTSSNYEFVSLLQLDLNVLKNTTIKSVVKVDFTTIKSKLDKFGKDLPNNIYLTCESIVTVSGSRMILTESNLKINKLADDKNAEIVSLLKSMTSAANTTFNFENVSNELISNIVSSIARASRCNLEVANNSLSFIKI